MTTVTTQSLDRRPMFNLLGHIDGVKGIILGATTRHMTHL
jgi:hypothetical protein